MMAPFLSQTKAKPSIVLALFLLQAATTECFVSPVKCLHQPVALESTATYKPAPKEIERAAEQPKNGAKASPDHTVVQGLNVKSPQASSFHYAACIQNNLGLKAKLMKLVKPRSYPLFLTEKAAKYLVDDLINPDSSSSEMKISTKEKVVILGAGWGSAAFLQNIDNDKYDVTVISPRNYFCFTPMLAGACVGTVDCRSIAQPIREFNLKANYLEAAASSIDPKTRTVKCTGVVCNEFCDLDDIEVHYDRLVVAVGAKVNTFGIPGVEEHCSFLKQVEDAAEIRHKIINLLERASMPNTPEEQLRQLLTFAIIGAGPTGCEFAAELRDFLEEDGPKYYPQLLKYVSIKVIEASDVVLRPFDKSLQKAAVEALTHKVTSKNMELFPENLLEMVTSKKVLEVTETDVLLEDGTSVPYGLAVWAGGIGPLPITTGVIHALGGQQEQSQDLSRGRITVDPWLRAIEGDGRVFALGDCTYTQNGSLPSTAQVAAQQGEYLAHLFAVADLEQLDYEENLLMPPRFAQGKKLTDAISALATGNNEHIAPFQFLDLGILAYTSRANALAQVQLAPDANSRLKASGTIGFGLWRSVYLAKQSSMRNRALVIFDWLKSKAFGRDITALG